MTSDKTSKRKRKTSAAGSEDESERPVLRTHADSRSERRYEPKPSIAGTATMIAAGLGALLAGAGTYAQWFRAESFKLAPYLLAAGAALMVAVVLFGSLGSKIVRVGDAGVGLEKDGGDIERIAWYDVTRIALTSNAISIHGSGTFIAIARGDHPQAVARIIAEAKARIPGHCENLSSDGIEKLDDAIGQVVSLEAPQAAGLRCKSSDKIIAFEKDGRFCGQCGEIYHKDTVPRSCASCGATLRTGGSKA